MAVLSGNNGTVLIDGAEVAPVSKWRLSITSANFDYVANDTGGWKKRVAAAGDCAGAFDVAVDEGRNCPVAEGACVTLRLHVDSSGNNYYELPAIIDKIAVDLSIGEAHAVGYAVEFSGNGRLIAHGILAH